MYVCVCLLYFFFEFFVQLFTCTLAHHLSPPLPAFPLLLSSLPFPAQRTHAFACADQSVLADAFFSDKILQIDFSKAPVSFSRLPANMSSLVLAENLVLCWDIGSGAFYACRAPASRRRSVEAGNSSYDEKFDGAVPLDVVESFRGVFGRSSSGTISVAGVCRVLCVGCFVLGL